MGKRQFDAAAIGELLLDCLVKGETDGHIMVEGNPGGAPCNVLAAMGRLGLSTAFIGKIGKDAFGSYLCNKVSAAGVDVSGIVRGSDPTTLAMVSLDENGNRDFNFYRKQTADVNLSWDEVDREILEDCRVFHFGTVSMTAEPVASATRKAVEYAKERGKLISFDPNQRTVLWESGEAFKEAFEWGMSRADFVKLSEEEQTFLTGIADPMEGGREVMRRYGLRFLAVTLGAKGMVCFHRDLVHYGRSYAVDTKDTTGAGDSMWGAALAWILKYTGDGSNMSAEQLKELVSYANAAGSCCTKRYGAIPAMADEAEIRDCMANVPELVL